MSATRADRLSLFAALPLLLATAPFPALAKTAAASTTTVNVELNEEGGQEVMKLDKATVPAGKVVFEVTNGSVMHPHEMIVVKTPLKPAQLAINSDRSKVDEKKFKGAKEVSAIQPGERGKLAMDLAPGHYVLLCNLKNHFKDGMYAEFTVTE